MIVPLAFAEQNKDFTIKNINGKNKTVLAEKGICCGNRICLMRNMNNNFIVKAGECQYILGFGFAKDIMVEC